MHPPSEDSQSSEIQGFSVRAEASVLHLQGAFDVFHSTGANVMLTRALRDVSGHEMNLSSLTALDSTGAMILLQLQKNGAILSAASPSHASLLELVERNLPAARQKENGSQPHTLNAIERVGQQTLGLVQWMHDFTVFLGRVTIGVGRICLSPKRFRLNETCYQIYESGIKAIPIICAMAFMIAIVLCYQGVAQLRPMGAEHLSVNLVSVSVLREMGVLLTAIMVAGRSGSAFAAEIGVMKVGEEIDALRMTGVDPFDMLVLPRLIALMISLPVLTFIADMMGLLGGGIMCKLLLGLPLLPYFEHVHLAVQTTDFWVGMIKAPVFAFLIAMVGCMHGLSVSGSAQSVGQETTVSVVKSIFLVLMADAAFSIVFEKVGL